MDRGIRGGVALLVVVASLALSGVAAGQDNQPPLAEAGLDQQATAGETVRLDATGSRDPDGNVTGYGWSIETPGGGTVVPDCETCGTSSFSPGTTGRYNVTVTVTDDDGTTTTDTLYVDVDPAPAPAVSLSGPTEPTVERSGYGEPSGEATYVANVSRGGHPIDFVAWQVDGEQTVRRSVNDSDVNSINYVHRMESAADHALTLRVVDTAGRDATDSVSVSPQVQTSDGDSDSGDDGYDPYMHAEWGDRTITFRAPTVDTDTGDVVQQSNPTNQELTNVATADPGDDVQTDFTETDSGDNENEDEGNSDPNDSYGEIDSSANQLFTPENIPFTSNSGADNTSDLIEDICPFC